MDVPDLPYQIMDQVSDPIAIFDGDGYVLHGNQAFKGSVVNGGDGLESNVSSLFEGFDPTGKALKHPDKAIPGENTITTKAGKRIKVIVYLIDNNKERPVFLGIFKLEKEAKGGGGLQDTTKEVFIDEELILSEKLSPEFKDLKGEELGFKMALVTAQRAAGTDLPLLITGESGTGKEILARTIHKVSKRKLKPFVDINCAAIPDGLIESELFGYERGAFTGARPGGREGLFDEAHEGSLFMDEIGDSSLQTQAKVLRVLQEGRFKRVGGRNSIKVDVRIISATNKDLMQLIGEGKFREDLFYRLNTITIHLPPLRERKSDIPLLLSHFLTRHIKEKRRHLRFSEKCMEILGSYEWPGNVRELKGVVDYATTMTNHSIMGPESLPSFLIPRKRPMGKEADSTLLNIRSLGADALVLNNVVAEVEKSVIKRALERARNRSEAIDMLGISRRTFYKKLREYDLEQG